MNENDEGRCINHTVNNIANLEGGPCETEKNRNDYFKAR
jgi:hypothetical protein